MISMVPKAWRKFKYERLTMIQKYIRGFLAHKKAFRLIHTNKLTSNFDYFDKIRAQLVVNSQIKIRYYWLK